MLLLGPTGSGKSPLGEQIASRCFLGRRSHHLDFGSELRSIASGIDSSSYTPQELDFIRGVLQRGLLLENEHFPLAEKIMLRFLDRSRFHSGDMLVLNGIPRHQGQAKDISFIVSILCLIVLDCNASSVYNRIAENTGGDRTNREDDALSLINKKLDTYRSRTEPLIKHYAQTDARIYRLAVSERTTAESAYQQLSSLATIDPPIAFVTEPPKR